MKTLKFLLSLLTITYSISSNGQLSSGVVSTKYIQFKDVAFEKALIQNEYLNKNGDKFISFKEALTYTGLLDVSNKGIVDLHGIQFFSNISYLNISHNYLTEVDLSKNTLLEVVNCSNNSFQSIDFSYLTELKVLDCGTNLLSNLIVQNNEYLTKLTCSNNLLESLYVSENAALVTLDFSGNKVTYMDLSENSSLSRLDCSSNKLQTLDLSNGNNTSMPSSAINMKNNSLNCIQVDNKAYSNDNWTDAKDYKSYFSENCNKINDTNTTTSSELSVFPNPTTDNITINLGSIKDDISVNVINSQGKVVMTEQVSESSIVDMNLDLESGLYFVNVKTKDGDDKTFKLVVN